MFDRKQYMIIYFAGMFEDIPFIRPALLRQNHPIIAD